MKSSKSAIRAQISAWRQDLSTNEWSANSRSICTRLLELDQLKTARTVHAFWPLTAKKEVDIRPLIRSLSSHNIRVYLPIVDGNELLHGLYTKKEDFKLNSFGGFEPRPDPTFVMEDVDCILVPALAADLSGNRIGYGKGFYDRFLSESKALKIAPIFAIQLVQGIPSEPYDVPVDILVTELDVYNANRM